MAVKNGRITAVGDDHAILGTERGPRTKVINLGGRMVLPGLTDSHLHPYEAGLSELRGPIPRLDSFAAIQEFIREQAAIKPKGEWIIVPRTFPTRLRELAMPTREVLDVATEHPVMFDASYVVVVNTYALKMCGIDRNTPNPPRGVIVKSEDGEPNGILRNAQVPSQRAQAHRQLHHRGEAGGAGEDAETVSSRRPHVGRGRSRHR